jgi:hypothetical protein
MDTDGKIHTVGVHSFGTQTGKIGRRTEEADSQTDRYARLREAPHHDVHDFGRHAVRLGQCLSGHVIDKSLK